MYIHAVWLIALVCVVYSVGKYYGRNEGFITSRNNFRAWLEEHGINEDNGWQADWYRKRILGEGEEDIFS